MEESAHNRACTGLIGISNQARRASLIAETLEDKIRFQRLHAQAEGLYREALKLVFDAEDAAKIAETAEYCQECGELKR